VNDNFHLKSDSIFKDVGTDLSLDANLPFTDDINSETRSGTWDIGADEYVLTCSNAGGTCKTNSCSTYVSCSTLSGTCDIGNCCSGICLDDTEAPTIPTNLSATAISTTEIDLSWTASTDNVGVTGYNIYRDSVLIDTSATNSYSDTGLIPDTEYTYTVSAYDAIPNNSAQSNSDSATTETVSICYVDNEATGTNTGTSWTNAWQSFADID